MRSTAPSITTFSIAGAALVWATFAAPVAVAQSGAAAPAPVAQLTTNTGEPWKLVQPPQITLVLSRDGAILGEIGREKRLMVSIRNLPKYLPQAFVAVEDKRFYQHDGVDLVGVAGAIKGKIMGANRGGASTITQQLVGNMHPDIIDRRENSGVAGIDRKLREQAAAREMERHYSKEQILEAYLNQISFGRGWFGVELAAQHYYGKECVAGHARRSRSTRDDAQESRCSTIRCGIRTRCLQRRNAILGLMVRSKASSRPHKRPRRSGSR